jgi:hypothetical protein
MARRQRVAVIVRLGRSGLVWKLVVREALKDAPRDVRKDGLRCVAKVAAKVVDVAGGMGGIGIVETVRRCR